MTQERYRGPDSSDDGVRYEDDASISQSDTRPSVTMEVLSPLLCDVPEVQIRADHFDDVWLGRVKDSDNPSYDQTIISDIDDRIDRYPLFS